MNYLAHLYLASPDPGLMFGGVLADFVRGSAINDYPEAIRQGIGLHIRIDSFTDNHPLVESARKRFKPPFRRYAGILIDLAFDHFLAAGWNAYSPGLPLESFAAGAYDTLAEFDSGRPERMGRVVEAMRRENWLVSYRSIKGVDQALCRLSLRLRRENPLAMGSDAIQEQYQALESDFARFLPDLIRFVTITRRTLTT